jgi:hypothetical protein
MQRVVIHVPRFRQYDSGDGFAVYGDGGTGSIDYGRMIGDAVVPFWPSSARRLGHLLDGHLMLPHISTAWLDGHLAGMHLIGEHLWPAGVIRFETPLYYFGAFGHVVRMLDAAGNWREDEPAVVATVVNSSPRAVGDVVLAGYEGETDRVAIEFVHSPELSN